MRAKKQAGKPPNNSFQESERQFRMLAENLPNMIFINVQGRVVYANTRASDTIGYSREEIYSPEFNFLNITAPESRDIVIQSFKRHMMGEEVEPYEYALITRDGRRIDTLLYSKIIYYKGKRAILGTVVDITIQKNAEEKLKEQERRKDEFITIASHELKTPLTSIKLYNQILIRSTPNPDDYLLKMKEQIDKLSSLVDQLLDVSKIQSGNISINREKFSLSHLITDTIDMVHALSPDHKISFVCQDVREIFADRGRIEQVLINLLTNAIKYSPDNKKIKVTAKLNKKHVIIRVKDKGIGIEEQHIKKIFDRFYRTTTSAQNTLPGLGMGLYISYEIIKLHGGKIWAESKHGKGSSFYFTLPLVIKA